MLNLNSLAVAAGQGSPGANKQITKLNNDLTREIKSGQKASIPLNDLTEKELISFNVSKKRN